MSLVISTSPTTITTFVPATRTLDFSAWTNPAFELQKILAVYNKTRDLFIYKIGDSAFGYTAFAANVLTLAFDTTTQNASDVLEIHYGEGYTVTDQTLIGQAAQTAIISNILTPLSGVNAFDATGYRSGMVQVVSTGTAGTFIFEGSNNNINFQTIPVYNQLLTTGVPIVAAIVASVSQIGYYFPIHFRYIRLRIVTAITGGSIQAFSKLSQNGFTPFSQQVANNTAASLATTATITSGTITTLSNGQTAHSAASNGSPVRIGGRVNTTLDTTLVDGDASNIMTTTAGQLTIKPFGSAENDWRFVSNPNGIVNTTTAVTIRSAGAANIKNYITAIDIFSEPLTNATELVIRDGATIIWRTKIPTSGISLTNIIFPTPLRGSAATAMEVATLTASGSGAVYFNAQGYQSF
jgi:hypothetical protein